MAQGNLYQVIPEAAYLTGKPPAKTGTRYEYTEPVLDGDGKQTGTRTVNPTWKEMSEVQEKNFGKARKLRYGGDVFYLVEFEGSFLQQEVQPLLDRIAALPFPQYRILTNDEAKRFAKGDLTDADEI